MGGQCAPADCLDDTDCGDFGGDCTVGVCNPGKTCEALAVNEGGGCDDGDLCSTGEVCSAGSCGGGPGPVHPSLSSRAMIAPP